MTLGPVQLLVVSFPEPNFSGQVIAELNRLREAHLVRLVDALAVQKNADGTLVALQWSDLSIEEAEDLGATVGALIGLGLGDADSVTAGAEAGRAAGADGHLIDDAEMWNVADSIDEGSAACSSSSSTCGLRRCATRSSRPAACPSVTAGSTPWTSSRSVWLLP